MVYPEDTFPKYLIPDPGKGIGCVALKKYGVTRIYTEFPVHISTN